MLKTLLLWLLPGLALAQGPSNFSASNWAGGLGVGNGLELHATYQTNSHLLLLGRVRYKWWGPNSGPGSGLLDQLNSRSRQTEVAALAGYGVPVGRSRVYAAAGLAYVAGRQLGDYRYTTYASGFLSGDATYYHAYRRYQALALPLEAGHLAPAFARGPRPGLAFQADLNPEHSVYCVLLTLGFSSLGARIK